MTDVNAPGDDIPLKKIISSAVADLQRLIKAQVELAKLEIAGSAQAAAKTGGLITGALVMAGTGGLFLLVTIAYVLVALGLPVWAGFAIVTGFLFLVAVILGLMGRSAAKKITPPERTIAEINKTKAALSGSSSPATGTLPSSASD
jgi:hypothetical protein